jgi:hypothetical protein
MKTIKTLLCAVAAASLFVAGQASAVDTNSIPVLTVSGTLVAFKTNIVSTKTTIQTTQNYAFNNTTLLEIVESGLYYWPPTGMSPTNIPAKSYIVFNPDAQDEVVQGIFYVTNKNGFALPLSGFDTNGNYYSYAELDTDQGDENILGFDQGLFDEEIDDFNSVSAYNDSNVTNTSSGTSSSTAVFYVHDNPYAYNAADVWSSLNNDFGTNNVISSPNPTSVNYENAIEIQGILTVKSSTVKGINTGSGTFTGSGNALLNGHQALVLTGKATVTGVVHVDGGP